MGTVMTREVFGRERELGSVSQFLDRAVEGLAGLVLEGEAGIGKSTVWLSSVMAARERGFLVLSAELAEAEGLLAHVGLGDLFEDVLDDVLPVLTAPRRRALEFTLLRKEVAAGDTVDPRTLGVATRDALHSLTRDRRVLIAIDDVQWLDDASARALAFALRRSRDEKLVLLLARRVGTGLPLSEVERGLDAALLERLAVGPLSMGAIHRILQTRLGQTLPRPKLLLLHESSGGNPFYALELARALDAGTAADPTRPLHLPESLEWLVAGRLGDLSQATREALSLVAAGGRISKVALDAAGVAADALTPAFEARLIEQTEGVVRFTHPLLASALYQELPLDARAHAHRLLADAVNDPLARARHLALASSEADAAVAAEVEEAIAIATSKGASVVAAELAEHAVRLTPGGAAGDRHRRAITAARMHLLAGDRRRARAEAERLLTTTATGRRRADVLVLLSDVEQSADIERAIALRREALGEAASDVALQASIHQWLGWEVRRTDGFAAAEEHARAALELAQEIGDQALRAQALATLGFLRFNGAEPDALDMVEQASDLGDSVAQPKVRFDTDFVLAYALTWSGQIDRARTLLEGLHQELSERDELRSADALWYLSLVELAAGRLSLAAGYADRQREIKRQYAIGDQEDPLAVWIVARIAAHLGQLDRARELAELSRELTHAQPVFLAGQEAVLGLVAAWSGKPGEAIARFAAADDARYGAGVRDPSDFWWRADYAVALLEVGRIADAVNLLERWEADAARLRRERVLAQLVRCRGLVAAARGELEEAQTLLGQAVRLGQAVGDPFGRGQALLALGIVARRSRKKRASREAIEAALEAFTTMGAAGWAEKARAELGRIGGRTREEGLTGAERRVAALVAQGRTNREVAAALFLSEPTVVTHMTHVYAKLGVRSRAELARKFRPDEQSSGELTISR
jgi:DNA-binding CsgD family transcriptional regulator